MNDAASTLKQIFPHIPAPDVEEVVNELRNKYQDPELLLDRASSELLKGKFPNKKPKTAINLEHEEVHQLDSSFGEEMRLQIDKLETLQHITDIYPKVDQTWLSTLYDRYLLNGDKKTRSKADIQALLVNYMIDHSDYPKVLPPGQKSSSNKRSYSDYSKEIYNLKYRKNCLDELGRIFNWVTIPCLRSFLAHYKYHFQPIYLFLKKDLGGVVHTDKPKSASGQVKLLTKARQVHGGTTELDPEFFEEFKETVAEDSKAREEAELKRLQEEEDAQLTASGQVIECGCCYVDVPLSRVVQCAEGHLFCTDCIKKYMEETVFSAGKINVHCLSEDGCKANFPMDQLQKAVPGPQLDKILRRLADLEILKAGLENMYRCPKCDYQAELPENKENKIFICQNPECGAESCILCGEPNHIPLKCEEVEKQHVTDFRKKVEEAMTEGLIRTCPKCKAKFFKSDGCNKMTCACGAHTCYVCRAFISNKEGYNHFCSHNREPKEFGACPECNKCYLYLKDTAGADEALVEKAKQQATHEFAKDDSELTKVTVGAPKESKKRKQRKKHEIGAMGMPVQWGNRFPLLGFGGHHVPIHGHHVHYIPEEEEEEEEDDDYDDFYDGFDEEDEEESDGW